MTDRNGKKFIASYRIGDFPNAGLKLYPWKVAPCDGVLINAYDFLKNGRTLRKARELLEKANPLASLELPGELILDSGAYYFIRSTSADIDPSQITDLAVRLGVPYVVTLDHPFPPGLTPSEITKRLQTTARNTSTMFGALDLAQCPRPTLIPALHGHDKRTLQRSYKSQPVISDSATTKVGVGSLALMAKTGAMKQAAEAMMHARELLAKKHMHVFSVGSPLVMHFAFLCGADSVDSQSWMMSAAFKQAHLPGLAQTRLSIRERDKDVKQYTKRRMQFETQLLKLHGEEGFAVKDWLTGKVMAIRDEKDATAYTDMLEDGPQGNRVHWRACHNLSVCTFEARRVSQELALGRIDKFIEDRQQSGPYRKAAQEVLEMLTKRGLLNKENVPRCACKLKE